MSRETNREPNRDPNTDAAPILIGVTSKKSEEAWVARWAGNYMARLRELEALPVLLAPDAPALIPGGPTFAPDAAGRLPASLLDHLHGLVLCGGGDVHPRRYGQPMEGTDEGSIDDPRDEMELALATEALARDLPLFAICRGFQLLNVVAGGALIQHIDGHRADPDAPRVHEVSVIPGSRFARLVGMRNLPVNTYHHQGVDRRTLAPTLRPTAFDAQQGWLIEAFESPAHRWVTGVQWHPERMADFPVQEPQRRLWEDFVAAARAFRPPAAAHARRTGQD